LVVSGGGQIYFALTMITKNCYNAISSYYFPLAFYARFL
jgi:hypothetical protein